MKVIIDVETTGFDPYRNDIISLAALLVDEKLRLVDEFYQTVQADTENQWYSEDAEKVHGFTKTHINSFQPVKEFQRRFLQFLGPYKNMQMIYHARASFDWKFLLAHFVKTDNHYQLYKHVTGSNNLSTISVARRHKVSLGLTSLSLDNLCRHIGFDLDHHNALSDAYGCFHVLRFFYKELLWEDGVSTASYVNSGSMKKT